MADSNNLTAVPGTNNPHEQWTALFHNLGPNPDRSDVCIVCRDEMEATDEVLRHADCGNTFHPDCLVGWFEHLTTNNARVACPTCLRELQDVKMIELLAETKVTILQNFATAVVFCIDFRAKLRRYNRAIARVRRHQGRPWFEPMVQDLRKKYGYYPQEFGWLFNTHGKLTANVSNYRYPYSVVFATDDDVIRERKLVADYVLETFIMSARWPKRLNTLYEDDDGWADVKIDSEGEEYTDYDSTEYTDNEVESSDDEAEFSDDEAE